MRARALEFVTELRHPASFDLEKPPAGSKHDPDRHAARLAEAFAGGALCKKVAKNASNARKSGNESAKSDANKRYSFVSSGFRGKQGPKSPATSSLEAFLAKMEALSQQKHTGLANTREPQGELGALTLFAPHLDRATMAQRAVLDDGEAKTGAASFL